VRRLFHLTLATGIVLVTGSLAGAAPAFADTIVVHPGESIQKAIRHANPGDTVAVEPGVYHESVQIKGKDGITLQGSGATDSGTVLMPPDPSASTTQCARAHSGICVFGAAGSPVTGTRVTGFKVTGFDGFGIVAFETANSMFDHNAAIDDGEYGMTSFASSGNSYVHNFASGAEEAGFYYGDSPDADGVFQDNVAQDNLFGFFLRDAAHGSLWGNSATGNCLGFLFLDTGAPVEGGWWTAIHNVASRNDRFCPAGDEAPAVSGAGMVILGADGVRLKANHVMANVPSGAADISGGILVASSEPFGGSPPNDNSVRGNTVLRNKPLDIIWDGSGSGNIFLHNACKTSSPGSICA
jgi:hypothetical protein